MIARSICVAALAAVVIASCSDPASVEEAEGVRVEARSFGVRIENKRASEIYYFVIDREAAAYTTWVGCGNPNKCRGIRPSERWVVRGDEISSWGNSPEVIVYWWHLVAAPSGGFQQDSLRALVVKT